ncbi:MAG: NUDIX domain-containing protein [Nanoarchaeota archaeon]|nr:NUDIX domain-containing protein [Nanoarchaeota archaeon]
MKDILKWEGKIYEMEWLDKFDPSILRKLKQVYGFLFTEEGKLCIVRPTKRRGWRLPGGGPEPEDGDWKRTVMRESKEEADINLDEDSLKIVGLIKVTPGSDGKIDYALRVVGRIISIDHQTEDIAEGLINERRFILPKDFSKFMKWGKFGEYQLEKALSLLENESLRDPK